MKIAMLAAGLLALATPVWAQQAASVPSTPQTTAVEPVDPARQALARQMIEVFDMKTMMRGMFSNMAGAIRLPDGATDDQRARMQQMIASIGVGMEAATPRMVDLMVDVYARNFTMQEMQDTLTFYGSPSGKALLKKLPTVMQSVTPMVFKIMPTVFSAAEQDYCAKRTCDDADRKMFDAMRGVYGAKS